MDTHKLNIDLEELQREITVVQLRLFNFTVTTPDDRNSVRDNIRNLCQRMIYIGESVGLI